MLWRDCCHQATELPIMTSLPWAGMFLTGCEHVISTGVALLCLVVNTFKSLSRERLYAGPWITSLTQQLIEGRIIMPIILWQPCWKQNCIYQHMQPSLCHIMLACTVMFNSYLYVPVRVGFIQQLELLFTHNLQSEWLLGSEMLVIETS